MSPPESGDEKRREIIRCLEDEEARLYAQKANFNSEIDQKLAAVKARRLRAQSPLPSKDACPVCWYDHGHYSKMQPQSSGRGVDTFRCGECGNIEQRPS